MGTETNPLRILVNERDPKVFQVICKQFNRIEEWDTEIRHIESGDAALEHLREHPIDFAIVGYHRESDDGEMNLVRLNKIRKLRLNNPDLPILMVTQEGDERVAVEALKSGCDEYRKLVDINPSTLVRAIQYSLHRRKKQRELRRTSQIDGLTRLYNRRYLMEKIRDEMKDAIRHGRDLFVCMLDLDGFKAVNDRYGHISGDKVLKETAEIIKEEIRAGDCAGRYGGDEFLLVIEDTDSQGARTTTKRILRKIQNRSFDVYGSQREDGGESVRLTASAGVTEFDGTTFSSLNDLDDLQGIIDRADKSLYLAKNKGGNMVERRKYERIEVQTFPVQIEYNEQAHDAELMDYSERGVKLRFLPMAEFDDKITVNFETEDDQRIKKVGEIEWCVRDPETNQIMVGLDVSVPTDHLMPPPRTKGEMVQ